MNDKDPHGEDTKACFHQDGTVHTRWAPEDRDSIHHNHFLEQLRWVVSQFEWSGKRVLDIGTGKGRLAVTAAADGARVTGLDISGEMVADARHAAQDSDLTVDFILGDAELLPFPDQTCRWDEAGFCPSCPVVSPAGFFGGSSLLHARARWSGLWERSW